jgi:histidyl-tRNA synthetase
VAERVQAIRGMNDILPEDASAWQWLEKQFSQVLSDYGYQEIRFPLLEQTQLFKRSIGDVTDIVEKEMYTFNDLNGDSLTLRPEGTAGCLRACLEHGLLHNQQQKLWYQGPMFRHEKPQKGRYRQFNQLGVEALGIAGVGIELELILISRRFWNALGLADSVQLQINTLGTLAERESYRQALIDYFQPHTDILDEDCKKRLHRSPLRILDSKNPNLQSLIASAPKLMDVMSEESRQRFTDLCQGLDALGIQYTINPFLVRGLDYYGHLVFEWVTDKLGAQATVCAGGRYDKLVEHLGGAPTEAIGLAMGVERLLLLREALGLKPVVQQPPTVFMMAMSDAAMQRALVLAETLRNDQSVCVVVNTAGGGFKSQFKKADKSGARLAVIIGEDEYRDETVTVKDLRQTGEQKTIPQDALNPYILDYEKH